MLLKDIHLALILLSSSFVQAQAQVLPRPDLGQAAQQLPYGSSLALISEKFLGTRFRDSALGEGPQNYDSDPLFRLDAFDCTTFVETVWALSRSQRPGAWKSELQRIRYREGKIGFEHRLHFISIDWMDYHLRRGALQDISARISPKLAISETWIDKKAWFQHRHPSQLEAYVRAFPQEKARSSLIAYVSVKDLLSEAPLQAALKKEAADDALIVNIIRPDWDTSKTLGTKTDVSHQGLLLLKNGQLVLRHASAPQRKVVEDDFFNYLQNVRYQPNLKGLQFVRIQP